LKFRAAFNALFLSVATLGTCATVKVEIYLTSKHGKGDFIGTVTATDTPYGLLLTPDLKGLPPGPHGFHVHDNPTCADEGMGAGGHFDPQQSRRHLGPYSEAGHLGDLPVLIVDQQGQALIPLLAPRLTVAQIGGHALMIHAGGDTYSDQPTLGGGGARIACGVIPSEK